MDVAIATEFDEVKNKTIIGLKYSNKLCTEWRG